MVSKINFEEAKIINSNFARQVFPNRPKNSNKGTFGKVLNIAGCENYPGAAILSSIAPLKTGAGLVVLGTCNYVKNKVVSALPNVVLKHIGGDEHIEKLLFTSSWLKKLDLSSYNAVSIGCGLGLNVSTNYFLIKLINYINAQGYETPIIYDADALNIIAKHNINVLGQNAIITPHPGEMARLMQTQVEEIQNNREFYAKRAVEKFDCTVVLKGYNTVIATPSGKVYLDKTGGQILAKAGMGDVLTGIITGLCAQNVPPEAAAPLGVFIHSNAGKAAFDDALKAYNLAPSDPQEKIEFAQNAASCSLLASELLNYIPAGIAACGVWT